MMNQNPTPNTGHLPMLDPCPHFTRLDVIRAKLAGDNDALEYMLDTDCEIHESDIQDDMDYLGRHGL
jgi:hypothetical protein